MTNRTHDSPQGDKNKGTSKGLQNIVMQLKKACNHPYLCRPVGTASVEDLVKAPGKMQLATGLLDRCVCVCV